VFHLRFSHAPIYNASEILPNYRGYYRISEHYRFGLTQIFDRFGHQSLIILEDDMEIAPDFFSYFATMLTVLIQDSSLYCVSAWNDNGQLLNVQDPGQFYRADCFPGLGWMLLRSLWDQEFRSKWPAKFWDEFMREPATRRGRACLYPEINRVYTFGNDGVSQGTFFNTYLKPIKLNDQIFDFRTFNISRLYKMNYDEEFRSLVTSAEPIPSPQYLLSMSFTSEGGKALIIYYGNLDQLTLWEDFLGLMSDHKEGLPRASYRGVVPFRYRGHRVLLAPTSLQWSQV